MVDPLDASPPEWFMQAIAAPHQDATTQVAGCTIHYRTWGRLGNPAIMLVHGGGAHLHWWDFVAPLLADDYFVVAHDVGGMGDSGYRENYAPELFIAEVMAVKAAAGLTNQPALLAGHSMGGAIGLLTARAHGEKYSGLVMVDSPIRPPEDASRAQGRGSPFKPKRTYPDRATALARFRLIPAQPCDNGYILDYITERSVRETDAGWTWKFDDQVFKGRLFGQGQDALAGLRCPVAIIYGVLSQFYTQETIDYMRGLLPQGTPFIPIPAAHHHLFLDQPLAFVCALRGLLAGWPARST